MISPLQELKENRECLISSFSAGQSPELFQENYTEAVDQYFRRAVQESKTGQELFNKKVPFAFAAVGGYGRKELCLHSDVDILILFAPRVPSKAKDITADVFYPLWDLGLDLGYATRSVNDCLSLCKNDYEVLTSVMDARFLCGDSSLCLNLMERLQRKVIAKRAIAFGKWLEHQGMIRLDQFGDASSLLEPHLKDGIGGLRDYHHILWLAKVFFYLRNPRELEYMGTLSYHEYQELREHLKFIWLVRNHLHHLSDRKNDRLAFEYQEEIAQRLGFRNHNGLLPVEQFLGRLHSSMASVKTLHNSFVRTYLIKEQGTKSPSGLQEIAKGLHLSQDGIHFDSATAIISRPSLLMRSFEQSASLGCTLSLEAKRLVREFLYLVDDALRKSEEVVQDFLGILNGENTSNVLDQMYETGFLDAFIPEFGKIRDLIQFDAYHIFPVGRHSLETVAHLKSLPNQKDILLLDIFSDLENPEPLFLAALFHDVGKVGKGHAQKGVAVARNILKRFGYDKRLSSDVLFLIRHHLLMMETATRRDLNDEKVVVKCARTVADVARLKMLYLLTWADSKATGPMVWTKWSANLVQELFFKILHIFERGELATADASRKVELTKSEVVRTMAGTMKSHELDDFFELMSPRYLLNTGTNEIARHLPMVKSLKKKVKEKRATAFIFDAGEDEPESCWNVTFIAEDRPGLFSDIAGVLALNNINILSARIYTWRDGTAVDLFKVTSPLDPVNPQETWKKVKRDLAKTFAGKPSLDYRLEEKSAQSIFSYRKRPAPHPPAVVIDNHTSDFFTLIEVFADDRLGLLFLITRTLFNLRLDIRVAKVGSKGDQIADVFYVCDLEGQKVEDEEQVLEIKGALLHELRQG